MVGAREWFVSQVGRVCAGAGAGLVLQAQWVLLLGCAPVAACSPGLGPAQVTISRGCSQSLRKEWAWVQPGSQFWFASASWKGREGWEQMWRSNIGKHKAIPWPKIIITKMVHVAGFQPTSLFPRCGELRRTAWFIWEQLGTKPRDWENQRSNSGEPASGFCPLSTRWSCRAPEPAQMSHI